MSTQGASTSSLSSSSSTPQWKYDVFLSFKGEDTRHNFIDHICDALKQKGIVTFKDVEILESGKSVSFEIYEMRWPSTMRKAVEESRFAIVVLSRNYAFSEWCLDELAKIMECSKDTGMTVLPVFYDVDPYDVRNQRGTFARDFDMHEERFKENMKKVEIWRDALREVANLSGWLVGDGNVSELIKSIVEQILQNLSSSFSSITNDLVGIDSSLKELYTLYSNIGNNVFMIGICGMGGSGKTTLARVFYERFRSDFEGSFFFSNVREYLEKLDLLQLQKLLLADILGERNIEIRSVYHGVVMIKRRLCHKKVLIVLDDVNKLDQLENLAGGHDWFGLGSLIIITTRDEHLLVHHGVHNIYKPNLLCSEDALKLFCLKAFKNEKPEEDYTQLSLDVVRYANGHPFALVTFGSFLFGRTADVWQSALDGFKKILKREIFDMLKVSYDGLEEMWKDIFLDVACFFRGKMKDHVIEILETCGFHARIGIQVLMDKSLLTIENDTLQMHDLVQEMGMEIVRQESREEPGKRSRLWLPSDMFHVLTNNTATTAIQAIVLDLFGGDEAYRHIESYSEVFSKMCNLRLLVINNVHIPNGLNHLSNELRLLEWRGYSSKCLSSRFQSKELVELSLRFSKIEYLWRDVKYLDKLKLINLEHSIDLIRTPDFTGVPRLERLCLRGCINLVEIHPSIGQLSKLTVLNLEFCQSLISLPSSMDSLRSLEILILLGCSKLAKLPENLGKCLKELDITGTAIREVPSSISFLICRGCEKQFFKSRLDSVFCVCLLKSLSLSTNKLVFALPASISQLQKLESLNLGNCIQLHSLPEFPSNLRYINAKGCSSLEPSPSLLSMSNLSQPSISFFNCCKLVEYTGGCDGLAFAMLKCYLQRLIYPKTGLYETSTERKDRSRATFQISIPGLDVPEWLTNQSIGYSIWLELPPNWCNSTWMGFSLCALFRINCYGYSSERYSLKGHVKAYGDMPRLTSKVIKETSFEVVIGETSFDFNVCHLWLLYWSRDDLLGIPANDHECSWINVVFDSNSPSVEVIKCAVRLIYEQDVEEFNQTIAQCDVASEGLDCVHHEFENSTVVKATKIMRTYEDNNQAERSASWSFPEETESGGCSLDIDPEKASKGKQDSSSNATISEASSHRKRSREKDQLNVEELYEEVMKIEGFDEDMLASAFDYLVENERLARAFMAKNARLRTLWLEKFFNQND